MKQQIDIQELIHWTYAKQKAHKAIRDVGDNGAPRGCSSTFGAFEKLAQLGVFVDGAACEDLSTAQCPEDALMVHGRVLALDPDASVLVILHGLAGTAPDWHPEGYGRYENQLNGKGKPKPIYRDAINRTGFMGHKQHFVGTRPEVVDHGRAEYMVWNEALSLLANDLMGRLDDYQPVKPACDSVPWNKSASFVSA